MLWSLCCEWIVIKIRGLDVGLSLVDCKCYSASWDWSSLCADYCFGSHSVEDCSTRWTGNRRDRHWPRWPWGPESSSFYSVWIQRFQIEKKASSTSTTTTTTIITNSAIFTTTTCHHTGLHRHTAGRLLNFCQWLGVFRVMFWKNQHDACFIDV